MATKMAKHRQEDQSLPSTPPPPPPPPPPPERPRTKVTPIVVKLKTSSLREFIKPVHHPTYDPNKPAPTGPYFFYGTLADPSLLSEILNLEHKPFLRPAKISGYECRLWGQYPALLEAPGEVVHGHVYHVATEKYAQRLAEYETTNYSAQACHITYTGGEEPSEIKGHTFKFVGDSTDLEDGKFDLEVWLRRIGRKD
ncbi:hypothetical protein BJX64DRAFT_246882 [Aspergillus heterothallicus]